MDGGHGDPTDARPAIDPVPASGERLSQTSPIEAPVSTPAGHPIASELGRLANLRTPGQWFVSSRRTRVVDSRGRSLLVDPSTSLFEMPLVEREANLRLAAAVPDLLRILADLLKGAEYMDGAICGEWGENAEHQEAATRAMSEAAAIVKHGDEVSR